MDLNSYQDRAMSTRMASADERYALENLVGEVGELFSLLAKARRKEVKPDRDLVKKELGDILWQVAAVAKDFEFTLGDVGYTNIEKLRSRQERGMIDSNGDNR
jgi:NTP pyrophosphatase (non-canonical NTP hydrolase)